MTYPQRSIEDFWDAVAGTDEAALDAIYDTLRRGQIHPAYDRLATLLARVHPDLVLTLSREEQTAGRPRQQSHRDVLEISADGKVAGFDAVMTVVDKVPAWVTDRLGVRAFRSRTVDPHGRQQVTYGEASLAARDITWVAEQHADDPGVCDLTLYVPGWVDALPFTAAVNADLASAALVLLDHVVGEWASAVQIGALEVRSPALGAGRPLPELPDFLDRIGAQ